MNAQYLSLEMEEGIILSGMQSIDTHVQEVATILQWKHNWKIWEACMHQRVVKHENGSSINLGIVKKVHDLVNTYMKQYNKNK